MKSDFLQQTKGGLIVSCQALPEEPLHSAAIMARMAVAAAQGGACGIRANSVEDIVAIRSAVNLPIIGIIKKEYPDSEVRITPTLAEIDALMEARVDVIAMDATPRQRPCGTNLRQIFLAAKKKYPQQLFMADCASLEDALFAQKLGFDLAASTLCGYTEKTCDNSLPSYKLLRQMGRHLQIPVIAEGGIHSPAQFSRIVNMEGIHCAVIGTAITRPREITRQFMQALSDSTQAAQTRVMVFDIGGTSLKYGSFDHSLQPAFLKQCPTGASQGVQHIVDQICALATQQMPLDCISISTSGQVSLEDGSILFATHAIPGYTGVPLKELVQQRVRVPVHVANDANSAALGEAVFGAGYGLSDFLCLTYGTGVGGAIVMNHTIMTGSQGVAGEVGHIVTHKDGLPCACGQRGCYEQYASTKALERRVAQRLRQPIVGEEIFKRLQEPAIHNEVDAWIDEIICGLVTLIHIFNPKHIILSGAVIQQPYLYREINCRLRSNVMPSFQNVQVLRAKIDVFSGLYGAYYNAIHVHTTKEME